MYTQFWGKNGDERVATRVIDRVVGRERDPVGARLEDTVRDLLGRKGCSDFDVQRAVSRKARANEMDVLECAVQARICFEQDPTVTCWLTVGRREDDRFFFRASEMHLGAASHFNQVLRLKVDPGLHR